MGLLDQLAGQLLGGGNNQGGGGIAQIALQLLQQHEGGVAGLVEKFAGAGLGEQVQSWIGTGANLPISADQLASALGPDTLSKIAGQLGLDHGGAAAALAQVLPQLIDHATPAGTTHGADAVLAGSGGDLLGKLFG